MPIKHYPPPPDGYAPSLFFGRIPGANRSLEPRNWFGTGADGDAVISGTVNLPSITDGDVVVMNYKSLTINAGALLTVANRCRGLLVYVQEDCTINGALSMTGKGCHANPADAGVTANTPVAPTDGHAVPASGFTIRRFAPGYATAHSTSDLLHGCGAAAVAAEQHQPAGACLVVAIPRVGGLGGTDVQDGNPLTGAPGGGGGGNGNVPGGTATCFSGGPGAGQLNAAAPYGGAGGLGGINGTFPVASGGAGNPGGLGQGAGSQPGGLGTGGLLVLIVGGNLTIGASGILSADGVKGGDCTATGNTTSGSGSGGGAVLSMFGGVLVNSGILRANGGAYGANSGYYRGASGGVGAILGPYRIKA